MSVSSSSDISQRYKRIPREEWGSLDYHFYFRDKDRAKGIFLHPDDLAIKELHAWSHDFGDQRIDELKDYFLNRMIEEMSELLLNLKDDHNRYVAAKRANDRDRANKFRDRLIKSYDSFQEFYQYVLRKRAKKLVSFVNETILTVYADRGFPRDIVRDDGYDGWLYVEAVYDVVNHYVHEQQKGKDLILRAYSGWDFFKFYDEIPDAPRDPVLVSAPSAKKPRVVQPWYFKKK